MRNAIVAYTVVARKRGGIAMPSLRNHASGRDLHTPIFLKILRQQRGYLVHTDAAVPSTAAGGTGGAVRICVAGLTEC